MVAADYRSIRRREHAAGRGNGQAAGAPCVLTATRPRAVRTWARTGHIGNW